MDEGEKIKIWGIIQDEACHPMAHIWVKLLRKIYRGKHGYYEEKAETLSNSEGYYEFLISKEEDSETYKILVLKEEEEDVYGEYE